MTAASLEKDKDEIRAYRSRLGSAMREARHETGLTLSDIAERSGVPVATISRIERGKSGGSFDKITRIASALGRSFDEITQPKTSQPVPSPITGRHAVTRSGEGTFFFNVRYQYEVHAGKLRKKAMIPLDMLIESRDPPQNSEDWTKHEGEEFIMVLEGRVTVFTELYEPVTLEAGDSIYIDSTMQHAFATATADGTPSRMISICTSADFSHFSAGTAERRGK